MVLDCLDFDPTCLISLDFETFYSMKDFTLKKLTTEAYIRDPRFEALGIGVQVDERDPVWMEIPDFITWAKSVPWSRVAVAAHNMQFDGGILSFIFGIVPGFYFCTQKMARGWLVNVESKSLRSVMEHYDIGVKGDEVLRADGKRRKDFTPAEFAAYGRYCCIDTRGCYDALQCMLAEGFPETELWNIDQTIRWFTKPEFELDVPMMEEYAIYEADRKRELLRAICHQANPKLTDAQLMSMTEGDLIAGAKSTLMSNDKLADLLIDLGVEPPMKVSLAKTKTALAADPDAEPVMGWAFAKSDPGMQELLEHEDATIAALATARVAVKSTINETRTKRMLNMASRGAMAVQLNYGAAHTFRWGGAGKVNFQNLERVDKKNPRKGVIRKALRAPKRKKVVVADSAQIEARVLAWLSEDETLLEAFKANRDIYSEFATEIYGRRVDRKKNPDDFIPGFVAKCLAPDTLVLTNRGWVQIVEVKLTDLVWDGIEWVSHSGVLDQGLQETLTFAGITATPGHEMLTENGWVEWSGLHSNPSLFRSALSLVDRLSSDGNQAQKVAADGNQLFGVSVASNGACTDGILSRGESASADIARNRKALRNDTRRTPPWSQIHSTARDFWGSCMRFVLDVVTRITSGTHTTAGEEFRFTQLGSRTPLSFCDTRSPSLVGMSQDSKSIESMSTGTTHRETFGSSRRHSTAGRNEELQTCSIVSTNFNVRMKVYDLLSAGPRNRFVIWSEAGPLISHNCAILGLGYGLGWLKFAQMLLQGMLGGPKVQFTQVEADLLEVNLGRFVDNEKKVARVEAMPSRLDLEARLIHCAVAEAIVYRWRNKNTKITDFWKVMDVVLEAMEQGEEGTFGPGDCFRTVRHGIVLPSGLTMYYPGLRKSEEGHGYSYLKPFTKERVRLYGGILTENLDQAASRIIVADQMLRIRGKYGKESKLFAHDELVYIEPDEEASQTTSIVIQEMKVSSKWAPELPLHAEGGWAQTYGEAKPA